WTKYLIMEACLEGLPAVSIMTRIVTHSCRPLQPNPWLQRDVGIDTARLHTMAGTGFTGATEPLGKPATRTGTELPRPTAVMARGVALSLQQGEAHWVTHPALCQALQDEGLAMAVDAETVRHLQEPMTILAAKQIAGGPGRQALEAELAQLTTFVATQSQT